MFFALLSYCVADYLFIYYSGIDGLVIEKIYE